MTQAHIRTDARFPRHQPLADQVAQATEVKQLAHDVLHVERVYQWCVHLAAEAKIDPDLAGACALVHDLVHIPKSHRDRPLGSEQSAAAAGDLLVAAAYSSEEQTQVVEAVRTCSWSRGLPAESALGQVLQDADRLDAIGVIGMARCFSCAQEMCDEDSRLYHAEDPGFEMNRDLDDRHHALDHYFVKLQHLAESMHYPSSQAEAKRRQQSMQMVVAEMQRDVAMPGRS